MYSLQGNPYYDGPSLQRQKDSSLLQKVGENLVYSQDYAYSINKVANNKYEYGEMLRQQMRAKDDQQQIQRMQNQDERNYNKPNNYNPHTLSQLEKIRIQQQSSDIFNTGNLVTYQNANPYQQQQQQIQNVQSQYFQSLIVKMQEIQRQREEQKKQISIQSQPRTFRGSLQKEYYYESYFEEKERKQKAFAQSLADQINEKKLSQKYQERPQPIQYQPENEILEKNKQNILDSIMKINQKVQNDDQSTFQIQLDPTNSYNKNHILYHELNKPDNGYRWQPGGSWTRGKADFDLLKGLYRKQEEIFEKQNQDLKVLADQAQKQRDKQYVEMVIMRDKIQHNDKVRALNMNNSYYDSTLKNGENEQTNPQSYFYDEYGIGKPKNQHEKFDDIYFKHNYELPSQSSLLNPNYIEKKFDKLKQKSANKGKGNYENNIQLQDEDPNLEKMLDNFYKQEIGEENNPAYYENGQTRKRRNSMDAKVDLSKKRQKSAQNLNQSQFTEYNLLHQLEEEDDQNEQSQSQTQKSMNEIQNDQKQGGEQINRRKSAKKNQDNEFNDDISEMGKMNKQPEDINNLDISKIESQHHNDKKNNKNQSLSQIYYVDRTNNNDDQFKNEKYDNDLQVGPQDRPLSAFNKRNEVNFQKIKDKSEIYPYREIKEKSIYENQIKQKDMLIDFKKIDRLNQNDNLEMNAEKNNLDKSFNQDKQLDQILDDIGGLMKGIHIRQEIIIPTQNLKDLKEQMQFDKYQQISKLHTVNNYNTGQDNPYLNDVYRKQSPQKNNQVLLENTQENKTFLKSANNIDYLIGKLVEDRKIY